MTRAHAAQQLLRLGPLTLGEFITFTGWPVRVARKTLANLCQDGRVSFRGSPHKGVYEVADA